MRASLYRMIERDLPIQIIKRISTPPYPERQDLVRASFFVGSMEDGERTYGVKLRYAEQADIPIFALAPRHADLNNPIIECQEMSPGHHLVLALGRRWTPRS